MTERRIELSVGDVIEVPRRRSDGLFEWGLRSVIYSLSKTVFAASVIYEEPTGVQVTGAATMRPPVRKTGETWELEQYAEAYYRGQEHEPLEEIMDELRPLWVEQQATTVTYTWQEGSDYVQPLEPNSDY